MQQGTQNPQSKPKTNLIIIGVIVIAALFLLPRLFGNNATPTPQTVPTTIPQQNSAASNISLGTPTSSTGIDGNGCATDTESTFSTNQSIYVVAPDSTVPQGTNIYARLTRENSPIEDAPAITANQNYTDSCINFVFQPSGASFAPGTYMAQFFVNGNAGPSVTFNVQ